VTSVASTAPSSDFTVTGSPLTGSGTLALNWSVAPTNADTPNAIVKRDVNGAFSTGAIFAVSHTDNGIYGYSDAGDYGVVGQAPATYGVYGSSATFAGVGGVATTSGDGVQGYTASGRGVYGSARSGQGVIGESFGTTTVNSFGPDGVVGLSHNSSGAGVVGINDDPNGMGIYSSGAEWGVYSLGSGSFAGASNSSAYGTVGVEGYGGNNGTGTGGDGGVFSPGIGNTEDGYGVYAQGGGINACCSDAAVFGGEVQIYGYLTKSSGSFKIDHPLDPANKYLNHSFVESPDMMNIYNGNVFTDARGDAIVTLPEWFESLNRDFRYQLTVIGQFAQAIVASKVAGNQFSIKTDKPGVEVSWQVTGIRQDAWANAHRIQVEEEKPARDRGFYLHPELFGEPEEKGMEWARHPEMMKRIKEHRAHPLVPAITHPAQPPPSARNRNLALIDTK
jgi:hypothetical protein